MSKGNQRSICGLGKHKHCYAILSMLHNGAFISWDHIIPAQPCSFQNRLSVQDKSKVALLQIRVDMNVS